MGTDRQLNVLLDQITKRAAHRSLLVEGIEYQAHDRLRLLIGIDGEFPLGKLDVADRRQGVQLAAPCFIQQGFVHPAAQDVQFSFAHHPSKSQQ